MPKKKINKGDDELDGVETVQDISDSGDDFSEKSLPVNYTIGSTDIIDTGTIDQYEEEEPGYEEYEEIEDDSALAKKLKTKRVDEPDEEEALNNKDTFLDTADYDPEEELEKYYDN